MEGLAQFSNKFKSQLEVNENETKDGQNEEYVYPTKCDRYSITGIRDLTVGIEVDFLDKATERKPSLPCSSSTQMITFYFDNGCEMTIRASGTEPKIKWYSEIRKKRNADEKTLSDEQFVQQTKEELDQLVHSVVEHFLQPNKNGLELRENLDK